MGRKIRIDYGTDQATTGMEGKPGDSLSRVACSAAFSDLLHMHAFIAQAMLFNIVGAGVIRQIGHSQVCLALDL